MRARAVVLAFSLFFSVEAFPESSPRVALVDESGEVAIIDVASATVVGRVPLSIVPERAILSPDARRIAVLSRGEGTVSSWDGSFRPASKAVAEIVDVASMKVVGRAELGWNESTALFASDGTIIVLSPGVKSRKKPAEARPAQLTRISAEGEGTHRVELARPATSLYLSADGRTVAVLVAATPLAQAEVVLYDGGTLAAAGSVPVGRDTAMLFPSGDLLYVLDVPKNQPSTTYVVSLAARSLAGTIDTGPKPRFVGADPDSGSIFIVSGRDELQIVRGAAVVTTVKVAPSPVTVRFSPDRKLAYVVSNAAISVLDAVTFERMTTIESPSNALDFAIRPDGQRGFLFTGGGTCCHLTIVDLKERKPLRTHMTGSLGMRVLQAAALALGEAAYQSGLTVVPPPLPNIIRMPDGPMAIRPDGGFVYVLDPETNRLTIVATDTTERLPDQKAPLGATELRPLGGGSLLAAHGAEVVIVYDTRTNTEAFRLKGIGTKRAHWVRQFAISRDGAWAVTVDGASVVPFDAVNRVAGAPIAAKKAPVVAMFLE